MTLNVEIPSGKIKMENPVNKVTRACTDAALIQCGEVKASPLLRRVELSLVRE